MSIELKGRGRVYITEKSWVGVLQLARTLGWVPDYVTVTGDVNGLGYDVDDIPEANARALAKLLYQVIREIEVDSLSESLVEIVKTTGVSDLRAVADLAYVGTFYAD